MSVVNTLDELFVLRVRTSANCQTSLPFNIQEPLPKMYQDFKVKYLQYVALPKCKTYVRSVIWDPAFTRMGFCYAYI